MIYEAYFDGNTVRTVENIDIPKNSRVFVDVPCKGLSESELSGIKAKLEALDAVCGLLNEEEAKEYDAVTAKKLNFSERFDA